jgi:hypothetical protein
MPPDSSISNIRPWLSHMIHMSAYQSSAWTRSSSIEALDRILPMSAARTFIKQADTLVMLFSFVLLITRDGRAPMYRSELILEREVWEVRKMQTESSLKGHFDLRPTLSALATPPPCHPGLPLHLGHSFLVIHLYRDQKEAKNNIVDTRGS